MKASELFEAETRRWPKAQGRETPPTKEMIKWLNKFTIKHSSGFVSYDHKNYWVNENDGELHAYQTTSISFKKVTDQTLPPFKMKEAGWLGFDRTCDFTDFSWLPEKLGTLMFLNSNVKTFKGIHKHVKEVKELYVGKNTQSGLLDLVKIENLGAIRNLVTVAENRELFKAIKIIQKFKKQELDIFDIQEEFINAGLERFL